MLQSYLKIGIRNLIKNRTFTLINIFGLAVAIACCITAYVNFRFSDSFDSFHKDSDNIYLVNTHKISNDRRQNWTMAPMPLADALRKDVPGIEQLTRIWRSGGIMKYEEKVFNETFYFNDTDFWTMFEFPLIQGDLQALGDKSAIVITREIAEKYFGNVSPIGQQVSLSPDGEKYVEFLVQGVIENIPLNSSIRGDIYLPFANIQQMYGSDPEDWGGRWSRATIIKIDQNVSPASIDSKLEGYLEITNNANPDWPTEGFYLLPFKEVANQSSFLRGEPFQNPMPPVSIIAPSVIAMLVLLLACFNFVNTSIASSARRLKEIGVRKVMGGMRAQLIVQFIGENLLLCTFSLFVGVIISKYIFVPYYDSLWPLVTLGIDFSESYDLIGFLAILLAFTGIAAGAYPALYISKFNPIHIFRGKQKFGGTNPLIRVLLTLQFALAINGIISGLVMNRNADFIEDFDLGFDKEQLIAIPVRSGEHYQRFKSAIKDHPEIAGVAGSRSSVGMSWMNRNIKVGEKESEVSIFDIGENYFTTQGFELKEGRMFDHDLKTDEEKVIINETMAREMGFDQPLDQSVVYTTADGELTYHVIGVAKDFHFNGLWDKVPPAMMRYVPEEKYRYAIVKFASQDLQKINSYLQDEWKAVFPHLPYEGMFIDELQSTAIMVNTSIRLVSQYVAIISLLIAGMGLYALVSLNISRRFKEIGIRKVLGASMLNIGRLISTEFLALLVIASVLASAMGYFMMDTMLKNIWVYYVEINATPFINAAILALVGATLTVAAQIYRITTANPVDAIREE